MNVCLILNIPARRFPIWHGRRPTHDTSVWKSPLPGLRLPHVRTCLKIPPRPVPKSLAAAPLAISSQALRGASRRSRSSLACTISVAAVLLLSNPPRPKPVVVQPVVPAHAKLKVVNTRPLPAAMQVQTRADTVKLVSSRQDSVVMVSTDATRPHVREIDDGQLLALAGRAAALIRQVGEQARLVFFGEPDTTAPAPQ